MNTRVGSLSNGQRRIAEVAIAMLGDPRVYVLDEPTDGLDVNFAGRVREIVKSLHGIIIYTTHIMAEALELADGLLIMRNGKMVFHGDVSRLSGVMRIVARRERETRIIEAGVNELNSVMSKLRSEGFNILEVRNSVIDELLGGSE